MNKEQINVLVWMIVGWVIVSLLYKKSKYTIDVPNVHQIGTTDDSIKLVGAKPVSPLVTESVTYDFLDTLATLKGAKSVSDILMVDFRGMSLKEVSESLKNVNLDELIAYVKSKGYNDSQIDQFEKELILHEGIDAVRSEGTGIDCTTCQWKNNVCLNENNIKCTPGVCNTIDGVDPWPNEDPWAPTPLLETRWGCNDGKVITKDGICIAYDKEDPTQCVQYERQYDDFVPNTPVLKN